jgi:hypothetical protein
MVDGVKSLSSFTYSYAAEGRDDSGLIETNIPETGIDRLAKWHFIYVGYSRESRSVFTLAWFRDGT